MQARYNGIIEQPFDLSQITPEWDANSLTQAMSGVDDVSLSELDTVRDYAANSLAFGVGSGLAVTAFAASRIVGPAAAKRIAALGADHGWVSTLFSSSKAGWAASTLGSGALGYASGAITSAAVKSPNLHWFIAAPILFAKCLEEEVVSIMPLTKNGIPLVPGISLKDPAMMWRHMFGRLYNYAQDTAIGLQDMAWFWEMNGDSWWEKYVSWTSDSGGFNAIREDFRNAAGGGP